MPTSSNPQGGKPTAVQLADEIWEVAKDRSVPAGRASRLKLLAGRVRRLPNPERLEEVERQREEAERQTVLERDRHEDTKERANKAEARAEQHYCDQQEAEVKLGEAEAALADRDRQVREAEGLGDQWKRIAGSVAATKDRCAARVRAEAAKLEEIAGRLRGDEDATATELDEVANRLTQPEADPERCGGSCIIWAGPKLPQTYQACPGCPDCQPTPELLGEEGCEKHGAADCEDCYVEALAPGEKRERWTGPADIAWCPEHGLHGSRDTCFECGKPVEQIRMVPLEEVERPDLSCFWPVVDVHASRRSTQPVSESPGDSEEGEAIRFTQSMGEPSRRWRSRPHIEPGIEVEALQNDGSFLLAFLRDDEEVRSAGDGTGAILLTGSWTGDLRVSEGAWLLRDLKDGTLTTCSTGAFLARYEPANLTQPVPGNSGGSFVEIDAEEFAEALKDPKVKALLERADAYGEELRRRGDLPRNSGGVEEGDDETIVSYPPCMCGHAWGGHAGGPGFGGSCRRPDCNCDGYMVDPTAASTQPPSPTPPLYKQWRSSYEVKLRRVQEEVRHEIQCMRMIAKPDEPSETVEEEIAQEATAHVLDHRRAALEGILERSEGESPDA